MGVGKVPELTEGAASNCEGNHERQPPKQVSSVLGEQRARELGGQGTWFLQQPSSTDPDFQSTTRRTSSQRIIKSGQ